MIPKFRPVLDDEPGGRYRNILSESQGMLDYIRDHFVDLKPFEDSDNQAFNEKPDLGTTLPDLPSNKEEVSAQDHSV